MNDFHPVILLWSRLDTHRLVKVRLWFWLNTESMWQDQTKGILWPNPYRTLDL